MSGPDSDLYIYGDGTHIVCCACRITPDGDDWWADVKANTASEMLDHIKEHGRAGHKVPWYTIDRLQKEAEAE